MQSPLYQLSLMKKVIFLTTILTCCLLNIQAQEFDFDDSGGTTSIFVVWNVEGSAEYTEDGSTTAQEVISGMTLKETGTLDLKKNSRMKLSWKDQTLILTKKGTYSLKNEAKKLADLSASSPPSDGFLEAMAAASGFGEPGDGDGDRESGSAKSDTTGGSGWGTRNTINIIMPIGGLVPMEQITFSWAGISEVSGFRINIYNRMDQPAIFSALTMNNSFTVDVAQLYISDEEEYSWQVENVSDPSIKSKMTTIHFTEKDQDMEVIRGLQSDREYSYSQPWMKLLREAYALQKEEMFYAANEKYKQGLKEFNNVQTIRNMYAVFLNMHGLDALAAELMK